MRILTLHLKRACACAHGAKRKNYIPEKLLFNFACTTEIWTHEL